MEPGSDRALAPPWRETTLAWTARAAAAIAYAASATACLLDIDTIFLDGCMAPTLLDTLFTALADAMTRVDWEGVHPPTLLRGTHGPDAAALGGALLPLHTNFAPDPDLFLQEA